MSTGRIGGLGGADRALDDGWPARNQRAAIRPTRRRVLGAGDGARVAIVGSRQASPAGLARARKLARRLASEGIVFPQRNRTMALIADATVIVEASETSGALGQGREALRLGRLFYIARALVDDPALHWPARLLAQGARILSDATVGEFLAALPSRGAG